mmetsp:Transcript_734/g.2104  ORF Transcript_734/g.2104 Transcript_734/m.2104 type:complete len:86 (+) Transcript_734:1671-1928(+)
MSVELSIPKRLTDQSSHLRHPRCATDHHNLVNLTCLQRQVLQQPIGRRNRAAEQRITCIVVILKCQLNVNHLQALTHVPNRGAVR